MKKYILNEIYRKTHPTEIFVEKMIVSSERDSLGNILLHYADISGNLGCIELAENAVNSLYHSLKEQLELSVPLSPEILALKNNNHRKNYKYDDDLFKMKEMPKKSEQIFSLKSNQMKAFFNQIEGCLEYNAWIMLKANVDYLSFNEYQLQYYRLPQDYYQNEGSIVLWIYFNKKDAESFEQSLKKLFL